MNDPVEIPLDSLRRLARGLLYDRDRAEDLVQEAWLAALRKGVSGPGLAGWLAGAMRHSARLVQRSEARRREREERAARPEAQPSPSEGPERLEVLRRLLDAVERLPEPAREVILLRFFEDLPPR